MTAIPKPPHGLEKRGRALWTAYLADFDLDAVERATLHEACRTADELDRLSGAIASADVLAVGSQGQPVVSGLYDGVRRHRETLAKLLTLLKVDK